MIGDPKESGERAAELARRRQGVDVERSASSSSGSCRSRARTLRTVVNNYDWTASLSTIDFLRDIGKHFPVNRMLGSRRGPLAPRGRDLLHRVQLRPAAVDGLPEPVPRPRRAAADRRVRPVGQHHAGVELVRRTEGERVHALATPLVTKADGTKFGKTESGSIWLDAQMTSPYAFYQFWFNTDDRDVVPVPEVLLVPRRATRSRSSPRRSRRSRSGGPRNGRSPTS